MKKQLSMMMMAGMLVLAPPAWSAVEISCNGAACNPFGTLDYNYILMNTGSSPVTVTEFYIATDDLVPGNYSSFSHPAGFQAEIGSWVAMDLLYGVTEKATTGIKTDHGVIPSGGPTTSAGAVVITGGNFTLQPGGTVAFGFNHSGNPVDVGWALEQLDGPDSEGSIEVEMAGPWETMGYNQGFVHGVGASTTPVDDSTWGRIKVLLGR